MQPATPKRTISVAARRKMAAAQRARWAKIRVPIKVFHSFGEPDSSDIGVEETHYAWATPPGRPRPQFTTSLKRVPIAVSARGEKLGSPRKQEAKTGPELLLGVGGDLQIDNTYMRGIVLEGMTIHYSGGPLILENVTFVNCQFVIDNLDNGRALSSQLLASSSVNFKTSEA
jgi:hypothetical protein